MCTRSLSLSLSLSVSLLNIINFLPLFDPQSCLSHFYQYQYCYGYCLPYRYQSAYYHCYHFIITDINSTVLFHHHCLCQHSQYHYFFSSATAHTQEHRSASVPLLLQDLIYLSPVGTDRYRCILRERQHCNPQSLYSNDTLSWVHIKKVVLYLLFSMSEERCTDCMINVCKTMLSSGCAKEANIHHPGPS